MVVNQVYSLINNIAKASFGETAVNVVDTSTLVSLGDMVFSSDDNVDVFKKTLLDRIGKTVTNVRNYVSSSGDLLKSSFEYGCILQKLYVEMPEAQNNEAWDFDTLTSDLLKITKPDFKQKLFQSMNTWEVEQSIPDNVLKTAFTSAEDMASFIEGIFTSMYNSLTVALENTINLCRANFIGHKMVSNKECSAINLIELYKEKTGKTVKVDSCLTDSDFLKFSSMTINLFVKRLKTMSSLFNEDGYRRHTPQENLVIHVLADYASATTSYLESNTYHKELVGLPHYEEINYWQGSGESFDFDSTSRINVTISKDGAQENVDANGIIAVLADNESMGVTVMNRRSNTFYNPKKEITTYFEKAEIGFFNDLSENGIVFYVEDVA